MVATDRRALSIGIAIALALITCAANAQEPSQYTYPLDARSARTAASPYPGFDTGQETPRAPVTPPPAPDSDRARESRFLFEDALGVRRSLDDQGISFYASFAQFEQAITSGGFDRAAAWGGKFEMLGHIDSGQLGLWRGGMFDLYAESRLGTSIDAASAMYSPPNLAMFFPVPDQQITAITGLKVTQALTDRAGVFFGKLNALNGDREKFLKYPLTSRFWNAAFNFNLALDRYPYSAPGAGFYVVPERGPGVAFLVLDSFDSPRTSGLQRLGENGAFLYGELSQPTTLFGLPGKHILAGLFGTGSFPALAPSSFIELPDIVGAQPLETGTWTLLWNFEQRLWIDPDNTDRGVGLYVQTGLGDGDPNPVRTFFSVALNGNAPVPSRPGDTFGVGFYNLGISDPAKQQFPGLRDERGVEMFYNLRIVPGCHLTPDLQLTRAGLGPVDMAVIFGLRLKLDF